MALWQWALLLLALVWGLQSIGVWVQMCHYSDVFKGITNKFDDGYVGTGVFRGRLKKGAVAIVVVSPQMEIRRLLVMSGRSVFAKFVRHRSFEGAPLDRLRQEPGIGGKEPGVAEAIRQAISQIDQRRAAVASGEEEEFLPAQA